MGATKILTISWIYIKYCDMYSNIDSKSDTETNPIVKDVTNIYPNAFIIPKNFKRNTSKKKFWSHVLNRYFSFIFKSWIYFAEIMFIFKIYIIEYEKMSFILPYYSYYRDWGYRDFTV